MTVVTIITTALLASALTLGVTWFVLSKFLIPALQSRLESEILPSVEQHVKQGVLDAGEDLLPEFRTQVRKGFSDAMANAAAGGLFEETVKTAAKRMEDRVGSIFETVTGTRRD